MKYTDKYLDEKRLRDSLLMATLDCVADGGFHATPTDAIAKRAGVSAGTLFRHYPTKIKLLEAAFIRAARLLRGVNRDPDLDGTNFYEQLRDLWYGAARNAVANPTAFHYWRLYRATPLDVKWDFSAETRRLGPFSFLPMMMAQATGYEHPKMLDGWMAVAQWTAAVHFLLEPARAQQYNVTEPAPLLTSEEVMKQTFVAYWRGLGLDVNHPRVDCAYR